MATAGAEVHVDAPPDVVFDFVATAERIPEYVSFVREVVDVSAGPVGEGTVIRERAKPGPREEITTWTIAAFERPTQQVWQGRSHWVGAEADRRPSMEMTLTKVTEPERGGTRYRQVMEYRVLPGVRPLGWLLERLVVARSMRREFSRIAAEIKRIIESEQRDSVTPSAAS